MRLNFKQLALLGAHAVRGMAKLVDLTPARLDFLTVLRHGPLCQRDLAAKLCVSEPVISRMVRALMKLGLVRRVIPTADKRYRLVSLTSFGRYQYVRLTDCEWFLHEDACFGAQTLGESQWHCDWEVPLRKLGLGFLLQLFQHDYGGDWPCQTPWAAIRRHLRSGAYQDRLVGDPTFDDDWPWTVLDAQPPLHHGVVGDPLSDAYAAVWNVPPESYWRHEAIALEGGDLHLAA